MIRDRKIGHQADADRGRHPRPRAGREPWGSRAMLLAMAIAGVSGWCRAADPGEAADDLLRLAPADASLVISVEDLRDHFRTVGGSRLIAELRQSPAVKAWLASEKHQALRRACGEIEAALDVKLSEIRDRILGDAVVLVLRLPPGVPTDPSQARGLLLLRAQDPALLERLIRALNRSQRESGELARVEDRRRGEATYHVRQFPEGSGRPPECYVSYPDGTFAFSNSEELIRGVMDRKKPAPAEGVKSGAVPIPPGLLDSPRVAGVLRRLPHRPLARLYLDPRAVERLLALAPAPAKPADDRFRAMLRRHLAAVDYAGAALVWRADAIAVHAVETLDPARVDGWLRRWAADARPIRRELGRVPRTALVFASAHVELMALREAVYQFAPESDHQRLRNLEALVSGLMLGQDLASRILPAIGPGLVAYLDAPAESTPGKTGGEGVPAGHGGLFPLVVVADLSSVRQRPGPGSPPVGTSGVAVSDAIDSALRTVLTLMALDEKRGQGRAAIATSEAGGATVTTLSIPIPFAYAIDRPGARLVLGTSAASVARYLEAASDPEAGERFRDWQAAAFPGFETFICVDLDSLTGLASRHRERLARTLAARQKRPAAEVEDDLEQALSLARLFRAAFIASRIEPDASALHRCFGLIPSESRPTSATSSP